jgi:hypothetical protein
VSFFCASLVPGLSKKEEDEKVGVSDHVSRLGINKVVFVNGLEEAIFLTYLLIKPAFCFRLTSI